MSSWLGPTTNASKWCFLTLSSWISKSHTRSSFKVCCFLMRFSAVYFMNTKESWKQIILPSSARLQEFWDLQKPHPAYSRMASIAGFDKKMVPIAFHGDGTPVIGIGKIWGRQLTIFSMNSLLGLGSTKQMQIHLWSCFDETMSAQTLTQFFRILGWSLSWLQWGQWPDRDHNGKLYSFCLFQGRAAGTDTLG